MSGITGVVGGASRGVDRGLLGRMLSVMSHRGPEGNESYLRGDTWLGVCRLTRLDPSCGGLLMYNETLDTYAACDGYIYNHRELRAQLEGRGHRFRTTSDSEAIVHLYEEYGDAFAEHLQGDFGLAIVAGETLLLARDRFGMKPLYYLFLEDQNLFLFASEVKALLQYEGFVPVLDTERMTDYILPRFPVGPRAFVKGIKSVRPGHLLRVRRHEGRIELEEKEYYRLSFDADDSITLEDAKKRLAELLVEAVGAYLSRGEKVGLALSGGVDSSLIALTANRYYSHKLDTYTLGRRRDDLDLKLARKTAERIGSEHRELWVDFKEHLALIPSFVRAMERPLMTAGSAFHQFCRQMSGKLKFCMIGEAADEVFGGGEHHLNNRETREGMERGALNMKRLGLPIRDEVAAIVSDLCETESPEKYAFNQHRLGLSDRFTSAMQYYHSVAMDVSLELYDPYLYHPLIEFTRRLPIGLKVRRDLWVDKYLLRATAIDMFGPAAFDAVVCRKSGFGEVSTDVIARTKKLLETALPDSYLAEHPYGAYFPDKSKLLMIDLFKFIFIENRGTYPASFDFLDFVNARSNSTEPLNYKARRKRPRSAVALGNIHTADAANEPQVVAVSGGTATN